MRPSPSIDSKGLKQPDAEMIEAPCPRLSGISASPMKTHSRMAVPISDTDATTSGFRMPP